MGFDKFAPGDLPYTPQVKFTGPDFVVRLGPVQVALISQTLESLGAVQYHHLLAVTNDAGEAIYFVAAESNGFDQPRQFYLGHFDPNGHGTRNSSPLLLLTPVFFCAACRIVREYLNLDFEQAPLTEPEIQGFDVIPGLCDHYVPDWREHARWMIEFIRDGLPASHPGRAVLSNALDGTSTGRDDERRI